MADLHCQGSQGGMGTGEGSMAMGVATRPMAVQPCVTDDVKVACDGVSPCRFHPAETWKPDQLPRTQMERCTHEGPSMHEILHGCDIIIPARLDSYRDFIVREVKTCGLWPISLRSRPAWSLLGGIIDQEGCICGCWRCAGSGFRSPASVSRLREHTAGDDDYMEKNRRGAMMIMICVAFNR
eukprot:2574596-Amphidinium_carterae.2